MTREDFFTLLEQNKRSSADVHFETSAADGQLTDSFQPARASDFWGICWEHDTYNIWIQSGDIGVLCYSYEDGKWELDTSAARPDYVVSKYDHAE